MRKIGLFLASVLISLTIQAQDAAAEKLLNEVSNKMGAYNNISLEFSSKLVNKEAGIMDATPIRGSVMLSGDKYNLNYLGNNFIFDGKKLIVINQEEKEVSINEGNLEDADGFIYPSKLFTFYKEGYRYKMGALKNVNGRKIRYVKLTPLDSNSDIVEIRLGIDAKTKHIYQLIQKGSNGAETTYTIHTFKSNLPISNSNFSFDKKKYESLGYLID